MCAAEVRTENGLEVSGRGYGVGGGVRGVRVGMWVNVDEGGAGVFDGIRVYVAVGGAGV